MSPPVDYFCLICPYVNRDVTEIEAHIRMHKTKHTVYYGGKSPPLRL